MHLLFILLAVLMWGTDAAITKRFLYDSIAPIPMIGLRLGISALALLPIAWREFPALKRLNKRDWLLLAALVLVGPIGMNTFYYLGLQYTPAFLTVILFRLDPVFIILISTIFLKQHIDLRTWFLTLAAISFAAIISLGNISKLSLTSQVLWGILLVLMAALCSAISLFLAKDLLAHLSPLMLNCLRAIFSGFILITLTSPQIMRTLPKMGWEDIFLLIFLGIFFSALAFWLYYEGLKATSPLICSLLQLLRIAIGLAAAYILLNEQPTPLQLSATAALMVTLYLLTQPAVQPKAEVIT